MPEPLLLAPPLGAVVLFDGTDAAHWVQRKGGAPATWPVESGELVSRGGDIVSREGFRDFRLHIEFRCPDSPPEVKGQGRGNSGVFLQARYEVQVLDSWEITDPGFGDCGALYNTAAPLFNACRPPEQWQSYDVFFRAPRFNDHGDKIEKARVTILQNNILIQNNTEVDTQTGGAMDQDYATPGPILLQDHGNPVRFRNIWALPLPEAGADHY